MRVKALLRRFQVVWSQVVRIGNIQLDGQEFTVRVGSQSISLPQKEFQILYKLGSYPGKIFTRRQLIEQIWGMDYEGDERTVDVHIKRIRQRFKSLTDEFQIKTVRGLGYRLEVMK
jgi:two-component system, OmpR family, response regulator